MKSAEQINPRSIVPGLYHSRASEEFLSLTSTSIICMPPNSRVQWTSKNKRCYSVAHRNFMHVRVTNREVQSLEPKSDTVPDISLSRAKGPLTTPAPSQHSRLQDVIPSTASQGHRIPILSKSYTAHLPLPKPFI